MHRRIFIRDAAISAIAVSASGFITFNGTHYIGDCETTTDILGPFYRPGSPTRSNLLIQGDAGKVIELSGIVKHSDCKRPYKKAKIELWHCSSNGVYDNTSDEFLYRGTTYSDENGKYSFTTILPVPYDTGGGFIRPAHFHMMITAEGYLPLVTQLYFSGDPYLSKDSSSSSPAAKKRILPVQSLKDGKNRVLFNLGLPEKPLVESSAINRLTGKYIHEMNKSKSVHLFERNQELWMKNEVFGVGFEYIGNNTFQYPGRAGGAWVLHFEILLSGSVKLTETSWSRGQKNVVSFVKV